MTFDMLLVRVAALKIPAALNEFKATKKNPAPEPPFIVWLREEHGRGADHLNNILEIDGSIELYTEDIDLPLEKKIENDVLFDIEYEKEQAYIQSENMWQTSFDFTIVEKKRRTS